jgi:hypothetical protein
MQVHAQYSDLSNIHPGHWTLAMIGQNLFRHEQIDKSILGLTTCAYDINQIGSMQSLSRSEYSEVFLLDMVIDGTGKDWYVIDPSFQNIKKLETLLSQLGKSIGQ